MSDDLRRAAEEHFDRANALDQAGNREEAIKEWQETIALDSEHAAAHYNLGIAYADEAEVDLAIAALRQAVHLDPFDVDARRELADLYFEQDRFNDGIDQLRQALNIGPGDGGIANLLAQAYISHDLTDEAAGALEAGAMLEEDADLWFRIGKVYERCGRTEDAILAFRRALVCLPGHRESEQALQFHHVPAEEPPEDDEA